MHLTPLTRLACAALLLAVPAARAATFTVNTNAQTFDGTCDAANCSLRDAVHAANTTPGSDVVELQRHETYTFTTAFNVYQSAVPPIGDDLTVVGRGATLEVSPPRTLQVFVTFAGLHLRIENLTIRGGQTAVNATGGLVELVDSIVESSLMGLRAIDTDMTIERSTVRDSLGSGLWFRNYDTSIARSVDISRSAFVRNVNPAAPGGGMKLEGNVGAVVTDTSILDNVGSEGGGIAVWSIPSTNVVSLRNVTIAGNHAGSGGGIYRSGCAPTATNCTIKVTPTLESCILANNTADDTENYFGEIESLGQNIIGSQSSPSGQGGVAWGLIAQDTFLTGPSFVGLSTTVTTGEPGSDGKRPATWSLPVGRGDAAACSATDQLGNGRVAVCESGAIEARRCVAPPKEMADWWDFDAGKAGLRDDRAGTVANHAAAQGTPAFTDGMVGVAACFAGEGYLEVADDPEADFVGDCAVDSAEPFSIDAWVRDVGDGTQVLLDKREFGKKYMRGWSVFSVNGRLGFLMATGQGTGACNTPNAPCSEFVAPASAVDLRDGRWHFVAVTVRRCRNAVGHLYVDGQDVLTFTPRGGNLENNANLLLGADLRGVHRPPRPSDLCLDEVEIFKRVLAPQEITALYEAKWAGKCKGDLAEPLPDLVKEAVAVEVTPRAP